MILLLSSYTTRVELENNFYHKWYHFRKYVSSQKVVNRHILNSKQNFRIAALDLPAHGARMEEKLDLKSAHDSIHHIIDNEGKDKKIVLIGDGFGSCIAVSFVYTFPDACRLVNEITL